MIPALSGQGQTDLYEFKANLDTVGFQPKQGFKVRLRFKKLKI